MGYTNFLDQLLDPMADVFTPEVAEKIVDLRASPQLAAHLEILREKANEGQLSPEEDAEYKDFIEALDVLSIIQAKARLSLARAL